MRSAFIALRGKRTQQDIADAAGIPQSAITKIENNDKLGPTVGTFCRAIVGLGLPVSEFFARLEARDAESAATLRNVTLRVTPQTDKKSTSIPKGALHAASARLPPTSDLRDLVANLVSEQLPDAIASYAVHAVLHEPNAAKAPRRPRATTRKPAVARHRRRA